ncbi:MAG: Zn-ribbon domain-containing OB-fold protein [Lautropia sp.]
MSGSNDLLADPYVQAQPESLPFWQAAARGQLVSRRCLSCARVHWYPRAICPFCHGATEWVPLSGRGTLYAFSTLQRARPPYTVAYVTLAEGPTMMTNLVDLGASAPTLGMPLRVVFRATEEGRAVPKFTAL